MTAMPSRSEHEAGEHLVRELTTILRHVRVPIALVDREGINIWANDAFVATFGDLQGRHFSELVAQGSREEAARQFERKLAGRRVTEYEIDARLPDGRCFRAEISSVPIDNGRRVGAAVFGIAVSGARRVGPGRRTRLTPRQLEVLQLLADGASTGHIAAELHVTKQTVRNYVRQILQALRVHSRLEAVVKARREGIVGD